MTTYAHDVDRSEADPARRAAIFERVALISAAKVLSEALGEIADAARECEPTFLLQCRGELLSITAKLHEIGLKLTLVDAEIDSCRSEEMP